MGEPSAWGICFGSLTPQLVVAPASFGPLAVGPELHRIGRGTLDAAGRLAFPVSLPDRLPTGLVIYTQGATAGSAAPFMRLTNSVPILLQ